MLELLLACAAFVGTHLLMSHPLRAALVARLGDKGFMGLYSLVSFATLGWVVVAFRAAPAAAPLWAVGDGLWMAASALVWLAMLMISGSLKGNPAAPGPDAATLLERPATGMFAISRHPMMWGFALVSFSHMAVAPMAANLILWGAMAFLALAGAAGQDRKNAKLLGDGWKGWQARTSFLPFGLQLSGRASWGAALPSLPVLLIGTLIWLAVTWGHRGLGAGIWRWIG